MGYNHKLSRKYNLHWSRMGYKIYTGLEWDIKSTLCRKYNLHWARMGHKTYTGLEWNLPFEIKKKCIDHLF